MRSLRESEHEEDAVLAMKGVHLDRSFTFGMENHEDPEFKLESK